MRNTVPDMQRQHFEFIADTIACMDVDTTTRMKVASAFAGRLLMTNGQFNYDRFIETAMKE